MFNYRIVVANKDLFISIFRSVGKDYNDYKEIVNKYMSLYKPLSAWMLSKGSDEFAINDIVEHIRTYINLKKLSPSDINITKSKDENDNIIYLVNLQGNQFSELMTFIDFVHGNFPIVRKQEEKAEQTEIEHTPVLTGDGIQIFKVDKAQDSKELAADTSWCIAYKGQNNMWQAYRNNQAATFFIVWDENPPTPNQRKVALQYNQNGVQITDVVNRTGSNLTNDITFQYKGRTITGRDIPTYLTYLKSKGVDVDATTTNPETGEEEKILKNKPLTDNEKLEYRLGEIVKDLPIGVEDVKSWATGKFIISPKNGYISDQGNNNYKIFYNSAERFGREITIPEEFISEKVPYAPTMSVMKHALSSITIQSENIKSYVSKFVGMGWIMPNEVVEYFMDTPGGRDNLVLYVNTGLELPNEQVKKISADRQLLKSYIKQQWAALDQGSNNTKFLEYVDVNDEEAQNKILEISKKSMWKLSNLPDKWKIKFPQIGVIYGLGEGKHYEDHFYNQLAIAKGSHNMYDQFHTLEDTKIWLHVPEAIEPLKEKAKNLQIEISMPMTMIGWHERWKAVPDEFKDNPEFKIYKVASEVGNTLDSQIKYKDPKNPNDYLFYLLYAIDNPNSFSYERTVKNNPEFWKFAINNFDNVKNLILREKDLFHYDTPDDFDDEEDNIEDYPLVEDKDKQQLELVKIFREIPSEILAIPEIATLLKSKFDIWELNSILGFKFGDVKFLENIGLYVDNFSDLRKFGGVTNLIFHRPNDFLRNFVLNNFNEQEFMNVYFSITDTPNELVDITKWLPDIITKLSEQGLLKILTAKRRGFPIRGMESKFRLPTEFVYLLGLLRPQFLDKYSNELNIDFQDREDFQLPQRSPEEHEEYVKTKYPPIDEETTTAFVKSIVKVANKLDSKNKYKLADKFTNILRKYNV